MNKPKQVCWNCNHCDTFGSVCLKGKFLNNPDKPIILNNYSCEEFSYDCFTQTLIKNDGLNALNNELIQRDINLISALDESTKLLSNILRLYPDLYPSTIKKQIELNMELLG